MTKIDDFNYQVLQNENSDCIGALKIDGSDIGYPVVQEKTMSFIFNMIFKETMLSVDH